MEIMWWQCNTKWQELNIIIYPYWINCIITFRDQGLCILSCNQMEVRLITDALVQWSQNDSIPILQFGERCGRSGWSRWRPRAFVTVLRKRSTSGMGAFDWSKERLWAVLFSISEATNKSDINHLYIKYPPMVDALFCASTFKFPFWMVCCCIRWPAVLL